MAAVFGQYLDQFPRDPQTAQRLLVTTYDGQAVDAEQAVQRAGYRPAVTAGLPEGYTVDAMYILRMPCCTCVQCLCQREDGSRVAIFENDQQPSGWFGDRPKTQAICSGSWCSLVEVGNQVAASWRHGQRHLTVIGVRDRAELRALATWFEARR